jgi:hypothetical protein
VRALRSLPWLAAGVDGQPVEEGGVEVGVGVEVGLGDGGVRQADRESGPTPRAVDGDRPAVTGDDGTDDRQTEAGAARGARPRGVAAGEPLEHRAEQVRRDPRAVVDDLEHRRAVVHPQPGDGGGPGRGVGSDVGQQVGQHLVQPAVVAGHQDTRKTARSRARSDSRRVVAVVMTPR